MWADLSFYWGSDTNSFIVLKIESDFGESGPRPRLEPVYPPVYEYTYYINIIYYMHCTKQLSLYIHTIYKGEHITWLPGLQRVRRCIIPTGSIPGLQRVRRGIIPTGSIPGLQRVRRGIIPTGPIPGLQRVRRVIIPIGSIPGSLTHDDNQNPKCNFIIFRLVV